MRNFPRAHHFFLGNKTIEITKIKSSIKTNEQILTRERQYLKLSWKPKFLDDTSILNNNKSTSDEIQNCDIHSTGTTAFTK